MPVIALEEHHATPEILDAWRASDGDDPTMRRSANGEIAEALADLGEGRVATMDRTGVDRQVLSVSTPGVQDLEPGLAVSLAREANDRVIETVQARPERFGGFATLPTGSPDEAARELERAVGLGLDGAMVFPRTRGVPLDDTRFWPVLEAAEALRAPLYLHPQTPPAAVRAAYYDGLGEVSGLLATAGIGWHYDAGLQFVRLALSGALDRFPRLQVVLGHWGEVVLFYLDRLDALAGTEGVARPVSEYVADHVHVTPGGILSPRYLRWATDVVGVGRILFAVDHPFRVPSEDGVERFLGDAELSDTDREAITSGNWERLRAGIRR